MKSRMFLPQVSACKVVSLLFAFMAVALSGCKSTSMYPQAAAYDKSVHGFDKGNRAMLMCINLPPLQIRKNVELDVQSHVTKDPFEKVSGWYQEKLSGWTNVPASGQPKPEQCPTGVSYVSPENCRSGECSKQLYVLNEGPSETWIVNVSLK
jgi:hypothetical protein